MPENKPSEINQPSKVSLEACINLQNLYKEYKDRYKQFFESLVQKNDEELKMLTFRLDFNEYYTDKFYQASEYEFKPNEDFKGSGGSEIDNEQQNQVIEINEEIKDPKENKEIPYEIKRIEKRSEENKSATRKIGANSTKLLKISKEDKPDLILKKSSAETLAPPKVQNKPT